MKISPEVLLRFNIGLPVHIVKSLYPILGKEETLELVRKAAEENVKASAASPYYDGPRFKSLSEFLDRGQWKFAQFLTEPVHWNSVLVGKTTVIDPTSIELSENKLCFKITKCMWAELYKELDAAEIGKASCCDSDFPRAKVWSPKLDLVRTQTIMEGAPYCDFCYSWKD